nr:L-lactate permease [Zoogloea oryzae]
MTPRAARGRLFGCVGLAAAHRLAVGFLLQAHGDDFVGKMISPQSIAVACAAVGLVGKESDLFRFTLKHSLMFAAMVGIITTLQAYVFTWMIP